MLPTDMELKQVSSYSGPDSALLPAEVFFRMLSSVKRVSVKIKVMETMDTFPTAVSDLGRRLSFLKGVCEAVMCSEKLQRVLETVLAIGNIMNEGTSKGSAVGFTFDSLLKLTQTKSVDGKMTVLDYIVQTFYSKGQADNLGLEDIQGAAEASRMSMSEMEGEVRQMKVSLNRCKTEMKKMEADGAEMGGKKKPVGRLNKLPMGGGKPEGGMGALFASIKARGDNGDKIKGDASAFSQPENPRGALFASIKARKDDSASSQPENPRGALFASITARKKEGDVEKKPAADREASQPTASSEDSPGLARLCKFLMSAEKELDSLEAETKTTVQACKDLSLYFGDAGGEKSTGKLLSILTEFAANIKCAVEKYEKRVLMEKKSAAKAKVAAVNAFQNSKAKVRGRGAGSAWLPRNAALSN